MTIESGITALAQAIGADIKAMLATEKPFIVACSWNGTTTASVVLINLPMSVTVNFAAALAGSVAKSTVAATAQTDFTVSKNGTSIGTMRFAAAATSATFIAASPVSFAAGDVLKLVGPATPDATLSGLGISLKGTR